MAMRVLAIVGAMAVSLGLVTGADETKTMKGSFHWTDGGNKGDLEAVFTPTGPGTWDVAFHFEFRGQAHTYSGTAQGNLADGALEGRVQNEGKNRTWTFSGKSAGGEFEGTHAEVSDDGAHATGTLKLKG